ncbi:hypothetical protein FB451DRAFT_1198582 [Mycena latifolia]|nr:hypothetical protein FB451DRAFT_1198582 [Mycena latifolia]
MSNIANINRLGRYVAPNSNGTQENLPPRPKIRHGITPSLDSHPSWVFKNFSLSDFNLNSARLYRCLWRSKLISGGFLLAQFLRLSHGKKICFSWSQNISESVNLSARISKAENASEASPAEIGPKSYCFWPAEAVAETIGLSSDFRQAGSASETWYFRISASPSPISQIAVDLNLSVHCQQDEVHPLCNVPRFLRALSIYRGVLALALQKQTLHSCSRLIHVLGVSVTRESELSAATAERTHSSVPLDALRPCHLAISVFPMRLLARILRLSRDDLFMQAINQSSDKKGAVCDPPLVCQSVCPRIMRKLYADLVDNKEEETAIHIVKLRPAVISCIKKLGVHYTSNPSSLKFFLCVLRHIETGLALHCKLTAR